MNGVQSFSGLRVIGSEYLTRTIVKKWKRPGRPYATPKVRYRTRPSLEIYWMENLKTFVMHPMMFNYLKSSNPTS